MRARISGRGWGAPPERQNTLRTRHDRHPFVARIIVPSPADAKRHIDALAAGARPAGGEAEAAARDYCARALRRAGFAIDELPFEYSALPGRLGTPVVGIASLVLLEIGLALA